MRVAAIYDIHGNLPALEAVLDEIRKAGVDRILVGGDVVPGPMPCETLARLRAIGIPTEFIQGNGDREIVSLRRGVQTGGFPELYRPMMQWVADQLTAEDAAVLASWPPTSRLTIPGIGDVLFCHATPRNDVELFTRLTAEERLRPLFDPLNVQLAVCGHTHMQFDRMVGGTRVVNAGSAGMPFGEPGAYWLLLGPDVSLRHTPYDLAAAADRIRATGYPQAEEFAAANVLKPPTEAAMLEAFSGVALT